MSRADRKRKEKEHRQRQRAQNAAALVGVDAGKFTHALVVRPRGGMDSKPFTFRTTRQDFDRAKEFILQQAGGIVPEEIMVGIEFAGVYGFTLARYLHLQGLQVVSVLPASTKAWSRAHHRLPVKTDPKDAATVVDLVSQGTYVHFPFLGPKYAELRYLVSHRDRLSLLRNGALTRLKALLQIVFPEFESVFKQLHKPTAAALLSAYPSPDDLIAAPKQKVMKLLKAKSRNHVKAAKYEALLEAARTTVALRNDLSALKEEVRMLLEQIAFYERQIERLEGSMVETMHGMPEAEALMTIPGVAPVTAAVFLGSLGDVRAYSSVREVIRLAGLTLTENSSGIRTGRPKGSRYGKPLLRRHAFLLAVRMIRSDGLYRAQYATMVKRNGGRTMPALVAISREVLRLMFAIARERRPFTPEPPHRGAVEGQDVE